MLNDHLPNWMSYFLPSHKKQIKESYTHADNTDMDEIALRRLVLNAVNVEINNAKLADRITDRVFAVLAQHRHV